MKEKQMEEFMSKFKYMTFVGVDDLFIKKQVIRREYLTLNYFEKEIYKWYFFYQLCLLKWRNKEKKPIKDYFWNYINGERTEKEINALYMEFCNYRDKVS